ncbi:MAG: hypothetical protein J0H69_18450 [Burkholderiales bacterium]|nr:hypothetical protein [Burkholderiales bacterium]
MKTIVILTRREGAAAEALARLAAPEARAVWQGFADGRVSAVHGLQHGAGAVLELETPTHPDAVRFVEALPYVEEHLLDVQYVALKPFPGFATLAS